MQTHEIYNLCHVLVGWLFLTPPIRFGCERNGNNNIGYQLLAQNVLLIRWLTVSSSIWGGSSTEDSSFSRRPRSQSLYHKNTFSWIENSYNKLYLDNPWVEMYTHITFCAVLINNYWYWNFFQWLNQSFTVRSGTLTIHANSMDECRRRTCIFVGTCF